MTGQIGLFVRQLANGSGTTPQGARQALAGLLAKNSDGTVKVGVLADGLGAVVTGAAGMSYSIRKHVAVTKASEINGPTLVPNDGPVSVATDPAPGSNSRIDVVYVLQQFISGDGGSEVSNQPVYAVAKGATSATPAAPSLPTGALELARATVTAGTTATSGLTITQGPTTTANTGPVQQVYSTVPTPTVDGNLSGPAGFPIRRLLNWVSATTSAAGLVPVVFPEAFPNGVIHISVTTTSGASFNPVVNAGALTKTGATFIYPGVNNTAVKFTYEAVGW